jgi:hypothetical protein
LFFDFALKTSHQYDYQPQAFQTHNLEFFHVSSFERESFSGSKNKRRNPKNVYHEKKVKNNLS